MLSIKRLILLSIVSSSVYLSGCAKSPDSQFYMLNPASSHLIKSYSSCHKTILLEQIDIAKYLDRPNIVTRMTSNHLSISEFYRWAEPLDENIHSVIQQNLNQQLRNVVVLQSPLKIQQDVDYRVVVQINAFDMNFRGLTTLTASWYIYNNDRKLVLIRHKTYHAYVRYPFTYTFISAAMNKNITSLSLDIGLSLKRLSCK